MMTPPRFQILSLDGGGIRGIFEAALLASLEETFKTEITKHFDLIAGTSTGGIIAIGLGLGMKPRELLQLYVDIGPQIFSNRLGWKTLRRFYSSKYSAEPLKAALCANGAFGTRRIGDSTRRLVIPSFSLQKDDVRIFKTPHHERLRTDWKIEAWKVALATSAAPTYFPAFTEIDGLRLVDGGMWANNPTMVALTEAISLLNVPMNSLRILSLGTCCDLVSRETQLDKGGLWAWKQAAIEVAFRGQSLGAINQANLLLGNDRVFRLDPLVPAGLYSLDKLKTDELMAEAAHASLHFGPTFKENFMDHIAEPFHPLYPNEGK
jgi:uncharacterized protein